MGSAIDSTDENHLEKHLLWRLPDVISYLFQPSLWIGLFGLALLSVLLHAVSFSLLALITAAIIAGLELGLFFQITRTTAHGVREFRAPDFNHVFDDIVHPILLVIACALPMLVALYWGTSEFLMAVGVTLPTGDWSAGPVVLFGVGVLLFPLLLTIAAIDRSISGVLTPTTWLTSLRSFGSNYLLAALGFYGLWLVEAYIFAEIAEAIDELPIFGVSVLALVVLYIPRVLRYRLLGALCEPFLAESPNLVIPVAIAQETSVEDSQECLARIASGEMSSRQILKMANTAFSGKQPQVVYRAVEAIWSNHRDSPETCQALWVASQAQEQEGNLEAMKGTLARLVEFEPTHPLASEARLKLRRS
ncbi:MAG: hypothetical protein GY811_08805 [Myxococcales bacterium]|nr:hypothetical protein [Myxococcales bacterium]